MSEMVEVVIDSIRVGLMSQQRVVILREAEADRYLAIWIDPYMAEQITFALQEVEVARPMTHDLIREVVRGMDGRVIRVEVHDLKGDVFYGNIVVEVNGRTVDIDSRPSDALAVAVRTHVPILVARSVLDAAGIVPEEDIEGERPDGERPLLEESEMTDQVNPAEERLEAFEDFLSKLDIGDEDDDDGKSSKGKNN
ncbi:MAG: bifunctional nuclease family protein [Anaerolineales bacterium]|nr:bifunctional nuclease family protein [Anaerolineales bacterium]QYK49990.1 MAG: bifunctional nuclease family protein [Anaerolineales bacterium]